MIILKGQSAYTPFRLEQKNKQIRAVRAQIQLIAANYWYFLESERNGLESECVDLSKLLQSEAKLYEAPPASGIMVVPRLGTISPWTSKATELLTNCGFAGVRQILRGVHYQLSEVIDPKELGNIIFDPLTESVLTEPKQFNSLFEPHVPQPLVVIDIINQGRKALEIANQKMGLALNETEIQYLLKSFQRLARNPTDVELMMFAQVNSEHCRHKIFNAQWIIDSQDHDQSLFDMIRYTYQEHPQQVLVAYKDNAAVLKGSSANRWIIDPQSKRYQEIVEPVHIVLKVETHNHPTAISPFPGAATGSGGEIRDEAATGRGAYPKAGWTGFAVSHLQIPSLPQPWEVDPGRPSKIASPLEIMLQAPIGGASFNNEFGRPNLAGYFRTLLLIMHTEYGASYRGYHKPIMIAGGVGAIRESQIKKQGLTADSKIIVLGGPAMAIGLGGGSASSRAASESNEQLDFASVQRANAEMQMRCQQVINTCFSLGEHNPILSIHDVGAGGLANAIPEIVAASDQGAVIDLRSIPNAAPGMSPMEIWCNEAQERFVLAIDSEQIEQFKQIANRERCPFAILGTATEENQLVLQDPYFKNVPVNLATSVLFEDMPPLVCRSQRVMFNMPSFNTAEFTIEEVAQRVLQFPCVGSKSFLITIGDRSVTGLVARDQMIGPWQTPVSDVAVTCCDYRTVTGEAMAIGERPAIALIHPAAAARMAVGEAITNIAAARIEDITKISLSANWMAAPDYLGEGAGLYDAVQTVALELCPALGICIPVGKDSLSMRTVWQEDGEPKSVTAPISLIVTAVAPVLDVNQTTTPQLRSDQGQTHLILIDLGEGCHCMAGSVLEQVYGQLSQRPPDVDDPDILKNFFYAIQALKQKQLLLAYHDRSDGGLFVTLCEMMFAGRVGVDINLDRLVRAGIIGNDPIAALFTEELGAVLQVRAGDLEQVDAILRKYHLQQWSPVLGDINNSDQLNIFYQGQLIYQQSRIQLQRWWSETSYQLQALRDNPACAQAEYDAILHENPGL
ncbi:MAG: phosphoribosylformylglycinamidine synthase, partial [Proteobacteria bacterium]|nr:phosphoribosylformylglycinamidine synthase [Pseudomonadota bacterium]